MLVLARRRRESVAVGPPSGLNRTLKITVLEIKGSSVKLGFEAEKDYAVHRLEVWQQIHDKGSKDVRHKMTTAG